ncbi:AAA family ATPase [Sinorhizobium meliloti]|uniref:AAA family ATPase n=1 Tax=Rhizobium meliloti TaxID=382 RepID=UPI00186592F1|nr:AAA family ATPase [Sinorhizobium meliloti]
MTNIQKSTAQPPRDHRRIVWKEFKAFCDMLSGDPVLVPFKDGTTDWEATTRDSIEKLAHWSNFEVSDIPRLAILTDGFDRFIKDGADVSVVTAWNEGTPCIQQIEGAPCERAVDLIMDAIADDLSIEDMLGLQLADPMKPVPDTSPSKMSLDLEAIASRFEESRTAPVAANDNQPPYDERLLPYLEAFGGKDTILTADGVYGAVVDNKAGQIRLMPDGRALFVNKLFSKYIELPEVPKPLTANPFSLGDPTTLPQRDWLFGRHYIRRYVTASVGPGGGGKTAHSISEALAMVTGRPLLDAGGPLTKPLRVWWINAEDPQDEIDRRFHAAAKHFSVTNEQIGGRLFTDSGRDQQFVIARQEGRDLKVVEPFIGDMVAEIRRREIDVVIIDPFVSTHEAQENDNGAMQRVAAAWTRVADEANCNIELVHHVAKNQGEVTADSARGGGAFKDKVRSMRVFNVMTKEEAEKAGVENHRSYFRVDFGKINMIASGNSQWRRFVSVPLMNGKGLVKNGDEIGVVEAWRWPSKDAVAEKAKAERASLIANVPAETLAGLKVRLGASDFKASDQATNWAGNLVGEFFDLNVKDKDSRRQVKAMLSAWIDAGELEIVQIQDAYRRVSPHVKPAAAPQN